MILYIKSQTTMNFKYYLDTKPPHIDRTCSRTHGISKARHRQCNCILPMQPGNSAPRVLFRRYLPSSVVRSSRCEIDPDYIFDLDAICVFLCSSRRHSFHFADNRAPTIDNPCNNDACKL